MRFDLADLGLFRHVVEAGSITQGARRLEIDADLRVGGKKRTERLGEEFGERIGCHDPLLGFLFPQFSLPGKLP